LDAESKDTEEEVQAHQPDLTEAERAVEGVQGAKGGDGDQMAVVPGRELQSESDGAAPFTRAHWNSPH
jgi:hypothetical protein